MIGVGDTVVCVNDDQPPQSAPPYVVKGRNYTVSRIENKMWPIDQVPVEGGVVTVYTNVTFIWVAELPSQTGHYGFRFRKVEKKSEEHKTDISVFRKMLDKVPEEVR
jgi:hypothetical protein